MHYANNNLHTTTMSAAILSSQAMTSLMEKFPGMDQAQLKEIAGAVFEAVPPQKPQRKVKEIPAECRCMARMWPKETYDDEGNYIYGKPGQCCRRRKDGTVFCAQHQKAADITCKPLQFTNNGPNGKFKRHGLFHGRVDEPLPFHDDEGHLVLRWNDPQVDTWVHQQKEAGTYKEHPAWRDLWLGEREGGSSRKKKVTKKDQIAAEKKSKTLKFKKKRGLSPYFTFLAKKRDGIKAALEAAATEGTKISVADVTKAAGAQWKELKEAIDAAEKRIADGEELTDDERDVYKNLNDEMTEYVAASEASKKEAAEYNEAKLQEITASHELQLETAKSASPKAAPKVTLKLSAKKVVQNHADTVAVEQHEQEVEQQPEQQEQKEQQPEQQPEQQEQKEQEEQQEEEQEEQQEEQQEEEQKVEQKVEQEVEQKVEKVVETEEEKVVETEEEKDIFGDNDSEDEDDAVEADLEEFTHNGQTLFKMVDEENDGCFLILNRLAGGDDDEYEQWGTMDAEGKITKDDDE